MIHMYKIEDKQYEGHNEKINHPLYYTYGQIECIDYICDKRLDYWLGNAVKYITRAGIKDARTEIEDIKKAIWYLNDKVKRLENKRKE